MAYEDLLVVPNSDVQLALRDPDHRGSFANEEAARAHIHESGTRLRRYQEMVQAHGTYGLLILFQGMDAAGKDETIEAVFSHLDPQVCLTKQFKKLAGTRYTTDFCH